ncbi:MAG: hypothetical protein RKO25_00685 [Candidatus Contendobacter sp.]|nr:hypothetical protein [Candidatus Contendobacter sp.]
MESTLINRRLLLAKEFYIHARKLSKSIDSVSKMMAIHNFHIAVEITLKAIILNYEIRTEKQLNIDFESMMSEINNKLEFKIPYRQELRSLNSLRGLIQHQGIEPDPSSLEDFRVLTKKFLEESYLKYFEKDFSSLTRQSLITDENIKKLLCKTERFLSAEKVFESAIVLEGLFQLVTFSIIKFLPDEGFNSHFFVNSKFDHLSRETDFSFLFEPVIKGFETTFERIHDSEKLIAILSSGVSLSDLKKFRSFPFLLQFSIAGTPIVQTTKDNDIQVEDVEWALEFIISTILLWQQNGLLPHISDNFSKTIESLMNLDQHYV